MIPRESSNQRDPQISQQYEEISYSLKQTKRTFTKTELALAALLSIFAYTIFWILGVSLGLLIPQIAIIILACIIGSLRKKIQNTKLYTLVTDIFWCLVIALLNKFAFKLGIGHIALPTSILIGGAVTGIIRRKNFQQYMKITIVKYGSSLLLILCTPAFAFLGFVLYVYRVNIPFEYLHPSKVNEGWILIEENSGITKQIVTYQKDNSTLHIGFQFYPAAPATIEEDKKVFDTMFKKIKSAKLTREETWWENGLEKHILQYDLSSEGESLLPEIVIFSAWYCHNLKRNMDADALIKDQPIDLYINEVEEMVRSIKCP